MHPNRRFAVLVTAIAVVIGLIIWSPWSSGEDHSKDELLAKVSNTLEESNAPPELTHCFVGALAKNLTEDEVQSAYDALPDGADDSGLGVLDLSPELRGKISQYGILCLQRVMRSGKYKPQDFARMFQGSAR